MALTIEDFETSFSFRLPGTTYPFEFIKQSDTGGSCIGHLERKEEFFANVYITGNKVELYTSTCGISLIGQIVLDKFEKVTHANPL